MSYFSDRFDLITTRFVEAVLTLPSFIIAFLFLVAMSTTTIKMIIIINFMFTPLIARTVRAAVLTERHLNYMSATQLLSENPTRSCSARSCPTSCPPSWSSSPSGWLRRVHRGHSVLPELPRAAAHPGLRR